MMELERSGEDILDRVDLGGSEVDVKEVYVPLFPLVVSCLFAIADVVKVIGHRVVDAVDVDWKLLFAVFVFHGFLGCRPIE
jgi:hypothetical protein